MLRDRLELPPPDYKTGILPHEITEHKITGSTFKFEYESNFWKFAELILNTGAAGGIRTPISSLKWNFYVAVSTLVRVDLFKRPNH